MIEFVYFARNRETDEIKIGCSYAVERRLRSLRSETGCGLELLATTPGDRHLEDHFHAFLIEAHIGHEWFRPEPRVEAVVIAVREGWFDFSKLPVAVSPIRSAAAHKVWAKRRASQALRVAA